jgi:hypothetical protein
MRQIAAVFNPNGEEMAGRARTGIMVRPGRVLRSHDDAFSVGAEPRLFQQAG